MKKILIMMFGLLFAVSTVFASPTAKGDMVVMNKADSQFLFDGKTNAITLNKSEMATTEGKWLWFAARWGYTAARVAWRGWRTGGKTYSRGWHKPHHNFGTRKRPSWRRHYQWNTSHGTYRVPYGKHYLYKNRYDSYRSWWRR
jgi:hypothetical protein